MPDSAVTRSMPPAADDLAIVRGMVAGDRDAFETMMRRHNRRLYRLARGILRNDAEAEDALQEAYLSAYKSIGQFRGDAALFTWLSRLVLNECFGRLRRETRRQNVIPLVEPGTHVDLELMNAHDPDSPDKAVARAELRAMLERKLDALPDVFRVVFMLRSVEEMSVEETAQCLDIPEATVRSRHFRAKSMLRESLARDVDLVERDLFEFGGAQCDQVVIRVLSRLADDVPPHNSG
ncbi:RNA polymerase, sigma-24 subunit, ECF subfamily [Paraburkholderia ribeironis]|uniref:RNA polymerase, sigma-24 subunit, ECF subfamily n=1 Tax=Paraburkholderia ribeironis TaxID=1247936 RepID=A0A1N7SDT6_9BURK|nr:RNA polymerase sigma factor [Paraburkholderia ribeironis]SIT45537.1 RNA polymerase, sigma-24 subunit, ECF subfamily [Paraburkholderia ribeironis]